MKVSNKESRNAGNPLPRFLDSFFPDSKNLCNRERGHLWMKTSVISASSLVNNNFTP
jgi:hypothetical protein